MCGIAGIVGASSVNQQLYDALTVLQHRGQDAAGIITCDRGVFKQRKGNGLVRDVFRTEHMERLRDRFDLVEQVIDRRRELHLTQQQVAAAAGLHQSVVSRIEQGVADPTVRTLEALARALDARLTLTGRRAG